jgi:iron complex outermembrane receptor protein
MSQYTNKLHCNVGVIVIALATTLLWTSGARAQSSAAESNSVQSAGTGELTEIIVTAEKRSERLMDVPMSITAETGEQLKKLGITQVADLADVVPGFTYQPANYGTPIYAIRGIGFNDTSVGAASTVGVYVDQIPLPYPVMTEGVGLDLQRVEVLKGPQGTLFGQNSTAGAINYIAAKPTPRFEAGFDAGVGNFNAYNADGYASAPISDVMAWRVAFSTDQRGDWQQSETRDEDLGKQNFSVARILFDYNPLGNLHFELNANGWIDKSDSQASQFIAYRPTVAVGGYQDLAAALSAYRPAPNEPRIADWDPTFSMKRDDTFYQFSLHADWEISPSITLNSLTAFSELHKNSPIDADGTNTGNELNTLLAHIQSYYQELRLSGELDGQRLKWMIGGNYDRDIVDENQPGDTTSSSSGIGALRFHNYVLQNYQDVKTKAAFGSLDFGLTDTLTAQGSVRYTATSDNFTGCLRDVGGPLATAFSQIASEPIPAGGCVTLEPPPSLAPVPIVNSSFDQNNVSWRLGLSWKALPETLLYANATKGYKAGNFSTIPALIVGQYAPISQESVLAYEVGFKSTQLDRKLEITGAAFYYDYTDKQLLGYIHNAAFGDLPSLVNVPKTSVRGGEFDAIWKPVARLTLSIAGTYVDSKVNSSFITSDPFGESVDIRGEPFPNTPKAQFIGDVAYDFPLSDNLVGYVGIDGRYRSSTVAAFGGAEFFDIPAYGLLDVRAGVQAPDRRWYAQLWGRNVTDRFYLLNVSHISDTVAREAGMPATFGITVGYRYH